jgi:hypothetical protein
MARFHHLTALGTVLMAVGFLSFAPIGARADSMTNTDHIHVNGSYHSVTNGIPNYDGFDRFRDANGRPLPGWEQELSSRG